MSLSVAIMGHRSRMPFIRGLQEKLPDAELVLDRHNDRWDTGRRSLLAFDPAARWHVIVQDDAILCRDFLAGCEKAAQAAGDRPVGLYTGRVRPHAHTVTPAVKRALKLKRPWLEMEGPWWGVGIILPTACIPELVAWGDAHPRIANYDRRIAAYFAKLRIDCWYTVPSLVDHRPVAENPSLVEGRTGNRTAHAFIGDGSPLDIDWSLPPVRLNATFRRGNKSLSVRFNSPRYRRLSTDPLWEEVA